LRFVIADVRRRPNTPAPRPLSMATRRRRAKMTPPQVLAKSAAKSKAHTLAAKRSAKARLVSPASVSKKDAT